MVEANKSLVRIALAGHTTAGKTTLISTFRKAPSGRIGDMGNTTKQANLFIPPTDYESLQATFVDCPGFQNASMMLQILRSKNQSADFIRQFKSMLLAAKVDTQYDELACDAIKNSDVVIYVADIQSPADDSHIQEIRLINEVNPRIIVLLNKARSFEREKGKGSKDKRIKQWENKIFNIEDIDITKVLDFDAFWDRPAKIYKVYDAIQDVLAPDKRELFIVSLANFYERQKEIHKEAYDFLVEEIELLRKKMALSFKLC